MAAPESKTGQLQHRAAADLPTEHQAPRDMAQDHTHMIHNLPEAPRNMAQDHTHKIHNLPEELKPPPNLTAGTKPQVNMKTAILKDDGQLPQNDPKQWNLEQFRAGKRSALWCGLSGLQGCATMRGYTLNLAVIYLTNIAVATYVIGSYRTLEKRFNLSSRDIAALNTITDAVQVVSVLFVGYFGRKAHKPRVISVSVLFCVLGALLYATPYFIYGSKEDMNIPVNRTAGTSLHMCTAEQSDSLSPDDAAVSASQSDRTAYVFVALACISLGVGGSCVRVMGFVYIDENIRAQDTPLYVGLAGAVIPLGPILGFLLAALCTGLPENLRESQLSPEHPAYVGAWWLGFIIIGILVFISAVPMFLFPKHLPYYYNTKLDQAGPKSPQVGHLNRQTKALGPQTGPSDPQAGALGPQQGTLGPQQGPQHPEVLLQRGQQKTKGPPRARKEPINEKLQLIGVEVKGFVCSLWQLLCNVTLVMFTLHSVFDILVMMGLAGNLTRYLEIQFTLPAFQANIVTAVSVAVPGVLGNVAGGVIMKRYNLGVIGASVINTVSSFALIITLGISMGLGCEQINVAGNFDQVSNMLDVGLSCNLNCSCVADSFLPVCVDDHLNYLTACHAGCSAAANQTHFMDCGCAGDKMAAVSGMCAQHCPLVVPYIIMTILSVFFISLARVPSVVLNLRVVQPELKAFSLGIVSFADNLLGFIPAPILFGTLVDSACILWADVDGSQGACLLYDRDMYRLSVSGTCVGLQVMSFLLAALTWILVKRDVAAGRYRNIENEDLPDRNNYINHPDKAAGGKLNLAFSSHPDDTFINGSVGYTIDNSVSDELEWETDEALMADAFSLRDDGRTGMNLKQRDLSPSLLSLHSQRGCQEKVTAAPPSGQSEDWMMTSAMTVAMELMSVTHRYIMDVVQLSGEFSTSVVQYRDAEINVIQHRDTDSVKGGNHQPANTSSTNHQNSADTVEKDDFRTGQNTETVTELSRHAEDHATNTELLEANEVLDCEVLNYAFQREDETVALEVSSDDRLKHSCQTGDKTEPHCAVEEISSSKHLDSLSIIGMAVQESEA